MDEGDEWLYATLRSHQRLRTTEPVCTLLEAAGTGPGIGEFGFAIHGMAAGTGSDGRNFEKSCPARVYASRDRDLRFFRQEASVFTTSGLGRQRCCGAGGRVLAD